jgi:predicted metal-dependent enzyme (double-stranded beta helix superfamily)
MKNAARLGYKSPRGESMRPLTAAKCASPSIDRDLSMRPPEALTRVIALLRRPGEVDLGAAAEALQALDVRPSALGGAVCADQANYVRTLLYRDERSEMLLLTWMPGQRSPAHDHGVSGCVVRVVCGMATEHCYGCAEDAAADRNGVMRTFSPGSVLKAEDDSCHTLGNDGSEPLITLHIYAPPLR